MTNEQIRQNAVKYSEQHCSGYVDGGLVDAYIAGAHSRDEEIEDLKEEIESLKENEKELFEGFKKRGTKLGELMKENVKLRNQWISVEERLPAEFKPVIVMFDSGIIINAFATMVKDEPAWHPSVEIPIGSDVIFWMPIPELPK